MTTLGNTRFCNTCGSVVPQSYKFCHECGAEIVRAMKSANRTGVEVAVDVFSQIGAAMASLPETARGSYKLPEEFATGLMVVDRWLAERTATPLDQQRVCQAIETQVDAHSRRNYELWITKVFPRLPPAINAAMVRKLENTILASPPYQYPARYVDWLRALGSPASRSFLMTRRDQLILQLKTSWPAQYTGFSHLLHELPCGQVNRVIEYLNRVRTANERRFKGDAIQEYSLEQFEYVPGGLVRMSNIDDIIHYARVCAGGLDSIQNAAIRPATGDAGKGIIQLTATYKWAFTAYEKEGDAWGTNWFITIRVAESEFLACCTEAGQGNGPLRHL